MRIIILVTFVLCVLEIVQGYMFIGRIVRGITKHDHSLSSVPYNKAPESIRFIDMERSGKPPLLFLPGLDGLGNYSANSFKNLSRSFDITKVVIDPSDRSSFMEIAEVVISRLKMYEEPTVLMGESFGGLLASYVSVRAKKRVSKLILVNPATSYDR